MISFATLVTQFLDRPGLAPKTQQFYELTLMPLLQQYGQNPVETMSRPLLETYLNGLVVQKTPGTLMDKGFSITQ